MKKEAKSKFSLHPATWLNILLLGFFTLLFISKKNYEFLTYTVTLGILIYLIQWSDKFFKYSNLAKYGFSFWLFLHLAGGSFKVAGTRLYDLILIPLVGEPFNILRYDQVIHGYCYFVITLFVYALVTYMLNKTRGKVKVNPFLIGLIVVLASEGISAINEIIEFSTVAFFHATGVGDYYNNALDLVFNLIGAIFAVLLASRKKK
jgi:uncharacterized membrane protein YjdF